MSNSTFKIGIIGAGWIADKMARTVAPLPDVENYAIASRELGKAFTANARETLDIMKMMDAFRAEWGVKYPMD